MAEVSGGGGLGKGGGDCLGEGKRKETWFRNSGEMDPTLVFCHPDDPQNA